MLRLALVSQVLEELTGDETLVKFRSEYSRLFDALKKVRTKVHRSPATRRCARSGGRFSPGLGTGEGWGSLGPAPDALGRSEPR